MNIILVDDDFTNQLLLAKYFQKIGETNCLPIGTGE